MLTAPEELRARGLVADIDVELALALAEIAGEADAAVLLGAVFASAAIQSGHTCADLERLSSLGPNDWGHEPEPGIVLPSGDAWRRALEQSPLVASGDAGEPEARPLVLASGRRLYLARYFAYEAELARALGARVGPVASSLDVARFQASLERLFPDGAAGFSEKRRAAVVAVLSALSVITGGPGTGKTTTVAKILYLLIEQAIATGRPAPRIALLAPTGKAAQRLGEAIRATRGGLDGDPELVARIPSAAATLHRALGYQPRTPTRFRRNEINPLSEEIVVVDEASMVDLALMAKLVAAVRPGARLILLGDKDQLASVEAGSILADICGARSATASRSFARSADRLGVTLPAAEREEPVLADSLVELTHSHRFAAGGGIAELARAVNAGDATTALELLGSETTGVSLRPLPPPEELSGTVAELVADKLSGLASGPAEEKLALLDGFRVLAAYRRGPYGVEAVNALVERRLTRTGTLATSGGFFEGQPLIVTANDYELDLYNGDVGVVAAEPAEDSESGEATDARPLAAYFWSAAPVGSSGRTAAAAGGSGNDRALRVEGGAGTLPARLRSIPIGRLPPHETAFAISVHKSQGSEFDEVALLLGDRSSPLLTRELVYTAVTRARRRVTIFGSPEVLAQAIRARVERDSGLRERLAGRG